MQGWKREDEDWSFLSKDTTSAALAAPAGFEPPASMSFRDILTVEFQANMSSCVGHGGSSGLEYLQYLLNGGRVPMSRMAMYLLAQRKSGIRGDRGATIAGCVKAMIDDGCPKEAEFPYPNPVRYDDHIPGAVLTLAKKHRILGSKELFGAQEIFDWISQGKGPVIFGMEWYRRIANNQTGIIDANDLSGPSLGGHCLLYAGYSGKLDPQGKPLIDNINSHGRNWGQGGWASWTWRAIDKCCNEERGSHSFIGITDITGFDPSRLVTFSDII